MSKAMCMLKWTGKFTVVLIASMVIGIAYIFALTFGSFMISSWLFGDNPAAAVLVMATLFCVSFSIVLAYLKCYTTHFDKKSAS